MDTGTPLYRNAALRRLEARARQAQPHPTLMEQAGKAAAAWAQNLLSGNDRPVLILAGPGDNGGDAFEAAVHLQRAGHRIDVVRLGESRSPSVDARRALDKWNAVNGRLLQGIPPNATYDLVIDGLFGIGLQRPLSDSYAELVEQANAIDAPRLALDLPSGLDSDTGAVLGVAVRATHTLSFIAAKPGLYTLDGPDHCGEIRIADLGVRDSEPDIGHLLDGALLSALPLRRPRNFHKGRAGTLAIVGGAEGMVGAALLAGRAALRVGTGKVLLGLLAEDAPAIDLVQPELMLRRPDMLLADNTLTVIAAGPGMGTESRAQRALAQVLRSSLPVVLDADALNLIAAYGTLKSAVETRRAPTILTPHPAEAARLLGQDTATVQADRIAAAVALARTYDSVVVLKGNGSVCAGPQGRWWINPTGNAGMASAGMGDVLSGFIAALLAQGAATLPALLAAVHLHGAAGDALVARGIGPLGLTAGELIDEARALLNEALSAA